MTSLPKEMLIEIWSHLDFDTQKICALVSNEWKKYIRGSTRLSSEIYLDKWNIFKLSVEDINAVLTSWPKLQTLHVSDVDVISQHGINLKAQESLEKIIVSPASPFVICSLFKLKELMEGTPLDKTIAVVQVWLDPRNIMSPMTIENLLGIHFDLPPWQEERLAMKNEIDAYLERIRPMAIETLSINYWCREAFIAQAWQKDWYHEWILEFRNLKKLNIYNVTLDGDIFYFFDVLKKIDGLKTIQFTRCSMKNDFLKQFPPGVKLIIKEYCPFSFHITSLLGHLNSLGEMKAKKMLEIDNINLNIDISDHDLDEEKTEEIFKKAQEIIDEKFDELSFRDPKHDFWLKKEKGKLAVCVCDWDPSDYE